MNLDTTDVVLLPDVTTADAGLIACVAQQMLGMVRRGRHVIAVVATPAVPIGTGARLDPFTLAAGIAQPAMDTARTVRDAIEAIGVRAVVGAPGDVGPITRGGPLAAEPRRVRGRAISELFASASVVVLPGGVGIDGSTRDTVSLGEDGAFLTAVFVASVLGLDVLAVGDHAATPGGRARAFATRRGVRTRRVAIEAAPAVAVIGDGPRAEVLSRVIPAARSPRVIVDASRGMGTLADPTLPVVVADPRQAADLMLFGEDGPGVDLGPATTGVIPAIETLRSLAACDPVVRVQVSLSPASAAVFDAIADGMEPAEAVSHAVHEGLVIGPKDEALDGSSTAQRLAVLASEAFGARLDWRMLARRGLASLDPSDIVKIAGFGRRFRIIGTVDRTTGPDGEARIDARVGPLPLRNAEADLASGVFGFVRIDTRSGRSITLRGGVEGPGVLAAAVIEAARHASIDAVKFVDTGTTLGEQALSA